MFILHIYHGYSRQCDWYSDSAIVVIIIANNIFVMKESFSKVGIFNLFDMLSKAEGSEPSDQLQQQQQPLISGVHDRGEL